MRTIDRERLQELMERERGQFMHSHPRSARLYERSRRSLLDGVPMNWMTRWPGAYPIFAEASREARLWDVDGHEYTDFCLGDTGAMAGHSPEPTVRAVQDQVTRGLTTMLPTEDAAVVADELAQRFGVPLWQFTLTATDANRFAIRLCRQITGRHKVLVYDHCYHGSVDETFATLDRNGHVVPSYGNIGPGVEPCETTRVVQWNDVEALEDALKQGDVACVLAEPVMTNVGIVLPDPDYHSILRELTRRYGSLLILDETHTFCAGWGGYVHENGLEPDLVTLGKAMGGGIPCGAYGMSHAVAGRVRDRTIPEATDIGGIGGTLAANALSMRSMRATLTEVLTPQAFDHMTAMAARFEACIQDVIDEYELAWHVVRVGCRLEYLFSPQPPHNGAEAAAWMDAELDAFMHLYALNRGVLLTPFHMMALMCPATQPADVERHDRVFRDAVRELTS